MRRGEWFAGRPLRVRGPFEERNTGASSSRRERGFSAVPRRDRCFCPPATAITVGPFLAASTVAPSPAADRPVIDAPGCHCWVIRRVALSRDTSSAVEEAR
jgi:hypothetical protein